MKTESLSKYVDPTLPQVKEFCGTLGGAAPIPDKELIQLWVDKPSILAGRLSTLNYRPAGINNASYHNSGDTLRKVMDNLAAEGLVRLVYAPVPEDIVLIGTCTPADEGRAKMNAAKGIPAVIMVFEEDKAMFSGIENVFPYTGDRFSVIEIECFVRGVLFKTRDRLYHGKP